MGGSVEQEGLSGGSVEQGGLSAHVSSVELGRWCGGGDELVT